MWSGAAQVLGVQQDRRCGANHRQATLGGSMPAQAPLADRVARCAPGGRDTARNCTGSTAFPMPPAQAFGLERQVAYTTVSNLPDHLNSTCVANVSIVHQPVVMISSGRNGCCPLQRSPALHTPRNNTVQLHLLAPWVGSDEFGQGGQ